MQSLILDRVVGRVSPLEFATTICETFYTSLAQGVGTDVFPPNCHANAAVNTMDVEKQNYRFMLSGCADSSIKLWDLAEQEPAQGASSAADEDGVDDDLYDHPITTFSRLASIPRKTAHNFGVSCLSWWPLDNGMFISSSFDHTVKIWDTNELTPVHTFDLANRVYTFSISYFEENAYSASALVAVASDQPFIKLLDLRTSSSSHTLTGHKGKTLCVKWHPQEHNILASGGFDGEVKLWDIRRSKSCLARLDMLRTNASDDSATENNLTNSSVRAHSGPVNGLVWDELGHILYTAGNDDKIRVWDMVSSLAPPLNKLINFGPLTRNKYPQSIPLVLGPKYESELQYLLFPSDNGDIFVFRTIDGKLVSRLSRKGSKTSGRTCSMVNAGPFTGTYYCGTMDGEIVTWRPKWERTPVHGFADVDNIKLAEDDREFLANLQKTKESLMGT
ncbi:Piso0_004835 [Millerozyma farinosa CBS 7064]|uniref:Piso0_004835 protein n=1 Tax=Pichia sorbitophila (strain ATCC MYA-4447 / BCRC 22081 / CBS 7064 / NBRC 10061 / NRRL Y-12695) TaxID=559304 RepID=G8Y0J8_PICSO|nr:Piso0_004835 [Millerozyma farinosa CBS 7064]